MSECGIEDYVAAKLSHRGDQADVVVQCDGLQLVNDLISLPS
jgi:hypothetical protein